MALQFTRDVQVVVKLGNDLWEIPVLDGFSFSQAVNASEITVNEAGATSRRGRLLFNDSLAPVEWSFSTYARPTYDANGSPDVQVHGVEECLWAMFCGASSYSLGEFANANSVDVSVQSVSPPGADHTFNFTGSDISSMPSGWDIYFQFTNSGGDTQVYKITDAVVNSATIDFDIDGIATIQWSGFGVKLDDLSDAAVTPTINLGVESSANFIRNRISTVSLVRKDVSPDDTYNIVITGGSINFENNISYLTPEELGLVNAPLANITGTRSISGNLTCYLDDDISGSKSGELFKDLVSDRDTVRNEFDLDINVGGTGTPSITFSLPTAHLEIPVINVEDLLTLDIAFHGQPSGGNVDNQNEATIIYRGVAP